MSAPQNERTTASSRLDELPTDWALVRLAHSGVDTDEARQARGQLVERYQLAVWKYVLTATRSPDHADELTQEFSLQFMKGTFHHADPGKGELGVMIKASLCHMVGRLKSRQQRKNRNEVEDAESLLPSLACADSDDRPGSHDVELQSELLKEAQERMRRHEREHPGGDVLSVVLDYRTAFPDDTYAQLALVLSALFERLLTADSVRRMLHKARRRLARTLRQVARERCDPPTAAGARAVLEQAGLWSCCERFLRSDDWHGDA